MEKELLKRQQKSDTKALIEYVNNLDIAFICTELNRICVKENAAVILQLLFDGLLITSSSQEKRMKICTEVLKYIQEKKLSPKMTEKLLFVLSTQVTSFSTHNLIDLVNTCLQMLRESSTGNGSVCCWKNLIPKLVNKISEEDSVEHMGSKMKGSEYKSEIVITICMYDWPEEIITSIAGMFIDMPLSSDEHLKVVNKFCKLVQNISLNGIPALADQMFQLTKEKNFIPVFMALTKIFDEKLYKNGSVINGSSSVNDEYDVQVVEGNVLFHIYTLVSSRGSRSIEDFLKALRDCITSPGFILNPFSIKFLLTLSSISYTFEEKVFDIMKASVQRNLAEDEKIFDSAWVESVVPAAVPHMEIFNKIIENCVRERDKILRGLVNFGFHLLGLTKSRGKESLCERIWDLGSSILSYIVKKHGDVTNLILQKLVDEICEMHETTQYTDCLYNIVRQNPLNVLDCSGILIQLLGGVCTRLSGNVGQAVVRVILSLTKMSPSLRNNMIIALRKSLFLRDKVGREMAVRGILELLKGFKMSRVTSLSQCSSQGYCGFTQIYSETCSGPTPTQSNEGLCIELLTILREAFKHQQEVKTVFYTGVYEAVRVNPQLICHVLDNLRNQFDIYYRQGDDLPPFCFEKTVHFEGAVPVLLEPLGHLVLTLGLVAASDENAGSVKIREIFDSLCERMSDSDVPHFVDNNGTFDNSPESLAKEEELRQVLGVYEALIGYTLCTWTKQSTLHGQRLNSLFRGYTRLSEYVRSVGKTDKKKPEEKGKEKRGDGGEKKKEKARVFRFPATILNLRCACRLMCLLYEDSVEWSNQSAAEMVKNKRELHRYCLNVTLTLLKEAVSFPSSQLTNTGFSGYLTKMGRVLYAKCLKDVNHMKDFDLISCVLSLECFSEVLSIILLHFKPKFFSFLEDISGCSDENGTQSGCKAVLDDVLNQLNIVLQDNTEEDGKEEDALIRRLSLALVTIVDLLSRQLPREGRHGQKVLDKLKTMCKEVKVVTPSIAKSVLGLLLSEHRRVKASGSLLLDLALCICDSMQLIDDEMKVEDHTSYSIVNEKTATSSVLAVCNTLRLLIGDIEWLVARLKAEVLILSFSEVNNSDRQQEDIREREREMCRHVNFAAKVLGVLCSAAVPPGMYADAILKEIGNFYNKVTGVAKYFIMLVGKHGLELIHTRFDKTVKIIDHEVSRNMYFFTEYVIGEGDGSMDEKQANAKNPTFLKNKCLRETKIIPKVIYEKEQFQKFILQLSNKSKIDMGEKTKYTLARDYRLYAKQVKEVLEKENFQMEENEEVDETQGDEAESRPSKKAKLDE